MVKNSYAMIMIAEAADPNWVDQTATTFGSQTFFLVRLGARHGQKTADGLNAYTNICFFDGHVELKPTLPMEIVDGLALTESTGTILFLNKQQ